MNRSRAVAITLVVLVVLDLAVLAVGYRTRSGALPTWLQDVPTYTPGPTAAPSDTASTDPNAATIGGPLLLAANADGVLLRATRGACEAGFDEPARIWVGSVDDGIATVTSPEGLAEVDGAFVDADGGLRVAGLDGDCKSVGYASDDQGETWEAVSPPDLWRLPKDTTAATVLEPGGNDGVSLACVPTQVVNLPDARAVATCQQGAIFALDPDITKPKPVSGGGLVDLSATPGATAGSYYVFGASTTCGAQVGVVTGQGQALTELKCLGADDDGQLRAPLAIVTAGDRVVVQVGDDLLVSSNGGRDFQTVA